MSSSEESSSISGVSLSILTFFCYRLLISGSGVFISLGSYDSCKPPVCCVDVISFSLSSVLPLLAEILLAASVYLSGEMYKSLIELAGAVSY